MAGNHADIALGASRDVDVVETNAEPADHPEPRRRREQRPAHLGAIAHDQRRRVGERVSQTGRVVGKRDVVEHLETRGERSDGVLVHELGDDDPVTPHAAASRSSVSPGATMSKRTASVVTASASPVRRTTV